MDIYDLMGCDDSQYQFRADLEDLKLPETLGHECGVCRQPITEYCLRMHPRAAVGYGHRDWFDTRKLDANGHYPLRCEGCGETTPHTKMCVQNGAQHQHVRWLQGSGWSQDRIAETLRCTPSAPALELAYYRVEGEIRELTGQCSIVNQHRHGKTCHRCSRYRQLSARSIR